MGVPAWLPIQKSFFARITKVLPSKVRTNEGMNLHTKVFYYYYLRRYDGHARKDGKTVPELLKDVAAHTANRASGNVNERTQAIHDPSTRRTSSETESTIATSPSYTSRLSSRSCKGSPDRHQRPPSRRSWRNVRRVRTLRAAVPGH